MTGIERLRELAKTLRENIGDMRLNSSSGPLWRIVGDIADQIAHEHNVADREEHDAATWVREHGGLGAVRKMADTALDVYQRLVDGNAGPEMLKTDADTIDAMMAEIDEAIVKRGKERTTALALLDESVPRVTYERHIIKRQRQIDESHAALRRRNDMLARYKAANETLLERAAAMKRRLMPEGMEWPRFESGEPVSIGDQFAEHGGCENVVDSVEVGDCWFKIHGFDGAAPRYSKRASVKRPAPKVLDADGVEIRVGDTVWTTRDLEKFTVTNPNNGEFLSVSCKDEGGDDYCCYPTDLTHRAPVLAADGRPLRVGETVYLVSSGLELEVDTVFDPGCVACVKPGTGQEGGSPSADELTHERPVADTWERLEEDVAGASCPDVYCANHHIDASDASYEWAMARDIVRRARALAGRDA